MPSLLHYILALPKELIYKIMDELSGKNVEKILNFDNEYWKYRFCKLPQFKSRAEIFTYMVDMSFHPELMLALKRDKFDPFNVVLKNIYNLDNIEQIFKLFTAEPTALCNALKFNMLDLAEDMIRTGKEIYESDPNFSDNFMDIMTDKKFTNIVNLMIDSGYRLNIRYFDKLKRINRDLDIKKVVDCINWPDTLDDDGNTPLQIVLSLELEQIGILILDKCNTEWVNDAGDTALMIACSHKLTQVAMKLIECNPLHSNKCMSAYILALSNNMTVADKLLDLYQDRCIPSPEPDYTVLITAIEHGIDEYLLKKLIDEYPEKCSPSSIGTGVFGKCTALVSAIMHAEYGIARKIIKVFGDKCNPGAVVCDSTALLFAICDYGTEDMPLNLLTTFGNLCNIDYVGADGNALIVACNMCWPETIYRSRKIIYKLLELGCDVSCKTKDVMSTLFNCKHTEEIILRIIHAGYNIDQCSFNLFKKAKKHGYDNLCKELVTRGYFG